MNIGTTISDRYDIKMLIGDGGMANVYLAYDQEEDRHVAIKSLRYELSKDERFIKRFKRESMQVIDLHHPNIVHVYSVGDYKEQPFIVMEYVKGNTLKDYLREVGLVEPAEALHIMKQLAEGVRYAHENKIIHRDLKTQNIMITEEKDVKITDFGIALSSNEADITQTNTIMGSVHYLAPELARGNLATERSDIYALGIIFYELLTGTVPFKGEGAVNIALQHLEAEMPSIKSIDENLPANLDRIIQRCTKKRPSERYANVEELLLDLFQVAENGELVEEKSDDQPIEQTMDLSQALMELPEEEPMEQTLKMPRIGLLNAAIAAAYTIFLIIAFFLFRMITGEYFGTPPAEARIPIVAQMTLSEAERTISESGIDNLAIVYYPTDEVEEGHVIRTMPVAGTRVKINSEVEIFVAVPAEGD